MLLRASLVGLALAAAAVHSDAGPPYRYVRPAYPSAYPPVYQPASEPAYSWPSVPPAGVVPASGVVAAPPAVLLPAGQVSGYTPAAGTTLVPGADPAAAGGPVGDGLDEVNAKRAARGLRPFLRDEGLTQAAVACAQYRAARGLFGHTSNDFAFVPAGAVATSAGCAAYPAGYGWMSCCVYENYTYAGAAWVTGRDGRRYMHLFVR